MEIQHRSNEPQVERFQQKSPVYDRYIKEVAGDSSFVSQQSHIAGKQLDSRQVFVEALKITATAADSIYRDPESSMPSDTSNKLFQTLAAKNNQEMQFNPDSGELSYKDLKITASMVNGKLEANIFMRGGKDFNALIDAVKDFYTIAKISEDGTQLDGQQCEVGFPNANGKYEDFNHFYVTGDKTVVIDKHSFDIIRRAFDDANMIVPEYVAQKYKYYSSADAVQSAEEQQLAFTHKQLQEINEALRKPRADAQNSYEVDVMKQQMAQTVDQLKQQHNLEVAQLQQLHALEVDTLKQEAAEWKEKYMLVHE